MKILMSIFVLLMGTLNATFTSTNSTNPETNVETIVETEFTATANCCGTIDLTGAFCSAIPHPYYRVIFRRANEATGVELNVGASNYVQVDARQNYVLEFIVGNGTSCFPISATWTLCGKAGSGVIQPGGSLSITAGKDTSIPCFGQ